LSATSYTRSRGARLVCVKNLADDREQLA
jgi:hypothetical protein